MSITVSTQSNVTTIESLSVGAGETQNVTHAGMNTAYTSLGASSTPAVTKIAQFTVTLSSGALTVDLTSLTGTNGATVTGSGLRVQIIKLQAPTGNANVFTVVPGASNGYAGTGGGFIFKTGGSVSLNPGDEILWTNTSGTSAPSVDGTHKTLDCSGTGAQTLNVTIIFG